MARFNEHWSQRIHSMHSVGPWPISTQLIYLHLSRSSDINHLMRVCWHSIFRSVFDSHFMFVFFSLAFNSYNFELFLHAFATRLYMHDFHQDKSIDRRQSLFFPFHLLVSLFLLIISLLRLLVWLSDVAVVDAKCCKLKSNKAHLRSPVYVKIDGCTRR